MPPQWTKEALAKLTARRGEAKPPRLSYDDAKLDAAIVKALAAEEPKFNKGVKKKLADHALVSEVLARWKEPELEPRVQGCLLTMIRGWGNRHPEIARDLLRRWIVRGGLPFAVRARYEHAIRRVHHPKGGVMGIDFEVSSLEEQPGGGWSLWGLKPDELRPELAGAIAAAPDKDYAEVVATVGELRKRTKAASLRCDLTSLVPTERAWAQKDVSDLLAEKEPELKPAASLFCALGRSKEGLRLLEALANDYFKLGAHAYAAVRELEEDAIEPLAKVLHEWEKEPPRPNRGLAQARDMARALALFDDDRVTRAFEPWIGDSKSIGPVAVEHMTQFPGRAVKVLAPRLLEKTKGAEPAQHLLARLARGHGAEVSAAAEGLPKEQRAAVERLLGDKTPSATAASSADLPKVLRDPPWRRKGARPTIPIVASLPTVPYEERVVWVSEEERTIALAPPPWTSSGPSSLREVRKAIDAVLAEGKRDIHFGRRPWVAWHSIKDDGVLDLWNDVPVWARNVLESSYFSEVACMLARFGPKAIPGAIASVAHTMEAQPFKWLMRCDSPRVALLALRGAGRGALRNAAHGWMRSYPEAAVIGLLPIALGPAGAQKMDAAAVLREALDRETLRAVARRFGDAVAEATEALLAFDPLLDCPKSPPKLSAFADLAAMPEVRLTSGAALPEEAKRNLLEMLQFTPFDPPYAGVADVRGALDPASVDDLLRALLDAWVSAGAASASAWALRAIGHLGSTAIARELAAKIRKWPREKGRPRALVGVDVLGRMGTDVALMHLFDLSKTARNRHVEARAKEALGAAAQARGLTGDALEDRLVPSLDLDKDGTTTLDYGPRRLQVRVDEHLAPHVYEGDAPLPSLPRATKTDDAAKAKLAAARWKTLKSDLDTLAKTQLWRFEHAMIQARRWEGDEHRTLIVDHPLCGRVARKLIWAACDGDRIERTFRVADDGAFFDEQDRPTTLPERASIGLPHPLDLSESLKIGWARVLADYAIIQPFEQVGRATFAPSAGDKKKTSIESFRKRPIPYGVVFGRLESRGWRRGSMDEGSISTLEKDFGAVSAWLSFSPPLYAREKPPSEVTLDDVSFGGASLGELPAVAYSEAMYDFSVFTE